VTAAGSVLAVFRSRRLWAWLAVAWMAVVLVLGVALAMRLAGAPVLGEAFETYWELPFVQTAAVVFVAVIIPTLVAWMIVRRYSLWVGLLAVVIVVCVGAYRTDSVEAVAITGMQTAIALLAGAGLVRLVLPATKVPAVVRLGLAFAAGHGILGLAYLALGSFGLISRSSIALVWVLLAFLAVASLARGPRPRLSALAFGPTTVTGAIVTSLALGFVAFAALHAFLPETLSDAIRHHLPIAREIWETGSTPEFRWWTSRYPIHAQLVSVPAWGLGGAAGVALSHAVGGCFAAVSVAGVARMLAGRAAGAPGAIAAATFVTMPLFLWEVGHSYVDLYPATFVASALAAVLVWQRSGSLWTLILAGFLAGLAFATKPVAASSVAAIGLAVVLVGRERFSLRSRLLAGIVVFSGGLLILGWLWRSFEITGTVPGLDLLVSGVAGTEREIGRDLGTYGVGRSPVALLTLPWSMTFDGEAFGQSGAGAFGVLLLMALPTWLFLPRNRATALVLITLAFGGLVWAFTAQYYRYALPLLAVAAAASGAGIAGMRGWWRDHGSVVGPTLVSLLLIVALVLTPLMWLSLRRNQMPLEFLSGEMTREQFISGFMRGYDVLGAYPEIAGVDAPAIWVGGAQPEIYTSVLLYPERPEELGRTPAQVKASIAELGADFLIWDRHSSSGRDWASRLTSTSFLRSNARPLMVADQVYLFALGGRSGGWDRGDEMLPELGVIGPRFGWIPKPGVTTEDGLPNIPAGSNIKAVVDVEPDQAYVVQIRGTCEGVGDLTAMALWKNDENHVAGRDREQFVLDRDGRGLVIFRSPTDAASVTIHLSPQSGACVLSNASMRSIEGVEVVRDVPEPVAASLTG
jgi:hypothetical protein